MDGRDRAAHELGRVMKPGTNGRKLEKGRKGQKEEPRGETWYLWSLRNQDSACPRAFPIGRSLNL
jgi:hypothetical protein